MGRSRRNHYNHRGSNYLKVRGKDFEYQGSNKQLNDALKAVGLFLAGINAIGGLIKTVVVWFKSRRKIKEIEKQADEDIRVYKKTHPEAQGTKESSQLSSSQDTLDCSGKTWYDKFHDSFVMPADMPDPLLDIIASVPDQHQDAMLLQSLSMIGALCGSKLRAMYLDGKMHSPSLQVIIEGNSSSGKSVFNSVYQSLFKRMIDQDNIKLRSSSNPESAKKIIQNIGISITNSRFIKVLAENEDVHMYMFDSEISSVTKQLKGSSGLTYEHLRYAFDNDTVYQNNMSKNSVSGAFRVYLNYTFTGTPKDCTAFASNQLSTGTASRICWAMIPRPNERNDAPKWTPLESSRLKSIQNIFDELRKKYCFTTNNYGIETAVNEIEVDLGYVNKVFDDWIKKQKQQADYENNPARRENCHRIGAIGFRAALILDMLYSNDQTATEIDKQRSVCSLSIYVANYCMERFLHRFQKEFNENSLENDHFEMVGSSHEAEDRNLESAVMNLWNSGVKNKAEITRQLKLKFGDDIYEMKVGRIINKYNNCSRPQGRKRRM